MQSHAPSYPLCDVSWPRLLGVAFDLAGVAGTEVVVDTEVGRGADAWSTPKSAPGTEVVVRGTVEGVDGGREDRRAGASQSARGRPSPAPR